MSTATLLSKLCDQCRPIIEQDAAHKASLKKRGQDQATGRCVRAREMLKAGDTLQAIADEFGVSVAQAERMVLPAGPMGWRRGKTKLNLRLLTDMLDDGRTYAEIADALGCHHGTVGVWVRKLRGP